MKKTVSCPVCEGRGWHLSVMWWSHDCQHGETRELKRCATCSGEGKIEIDDPENLIRPEQEVQR
jgi:DnaJ-class molecular chaperone